MNCINKHQRSFLQVMIAFIICFCLIPNCVVSASNKYMKRYQKLEKKCEKLFQYDGTQTEMNQDSYKEYKLWDKELNYVYKEAKKKITSTEYKALQASERRWIVKRDKKAEQESAQYEGGTMQPLIYNNTMTTMTKKRIKWMIKNYLS